MKLDTAIETKAGIQLAQPEMTELVVIDANAVVVMPEAKAFKQAVKDNMANDYELARTTLISLLNQGMTAVSGAISLAKESESPRVYEATGAFIKTLSEISASLMDLSEKAQKRINNDSKGAGPQGTDVVPVTGVTNNNVFIATSESIADIVSSRLKLGS